MQVAGLAWQAWYSAVSAIVIDGAVVGASVSDQVGVVVGDALVGPAVGALVPAAQAGTTTPNFSAQTDG